MACKQRFASAIDMRVSQEHRFGLNSIEMERFMLRGNDEGRNPFLRLML